MGDSWRVGSLRVLMGVGEASQRPAWKGDGGRTHKEQDGGQPSPREASRSGTADRGDRSRKPAGVPGRGDGPTSRVLPLRFRLPTESHEAVLGATSPNPSRPPPSRSGSSLTPQPSPPFPHPDGRFPNTFTLDGLPQLVLFPLPGPPSCLSHHHDWGVPSPHANPPQAHAWQGWPLPRLLVCSPYPSVADMWEGN